MSNLKRAWVGGANVPDKAARSLIKYLQEVADTLIPYGDYVFDRKSLGNLINLGFCHRCFRYQDMNCCYANPPPMESKQVEKTGKVLPEAIMLTGDTLRQEVFNTHGAITSMGSISTRGHPDGYCMMSCHEDDDNSFCAIHSWCTLNGKNALEYKPYPCSLFPIDGIVMPSGKVFVFCSCDGTSGFTQWYHTWRALICVNYENLHKAIARDVGNSKYLRSLNLDNIIEDRIIDGYRPAYIEQEKVLRYFVGDDAYNHLSSEMSRVV